MWEAFNRRFARAMPYIIALVVLAGLTRILVSTVWTAGYEAGRMETLIEVGVYDEGYGGE